MISRSKSKSESELLSPAAIKKRDLCNQAYDRAYGECKKKGLAFYNQLLVDGFSALEAGDICRRELHMLRPRTLRELLPGEAKHQSMRRLPQPQPQSLSSSSSAPRQEFAANPPQNAEQISSNKTETETTELPQELKDYASVTVSTGNKSKFLELTGLKPQTRQGREGLLEWLISIPHAEWVPEGPFNECPKCKKPGYFHLGQLDKNGSYEIEWRHPDLKYYEWVICKIITDVKPQQQIIEFISIEPKDYDINELPKYNRGILIRIVQYLHNEIAKLKSTVRGGKYMGYEQASNYARGLKLTTRKEWREYVKSKSDSFPSNIPKRPDHIYANEWKGWGLFFGK